MKRLLIIVLLFWSCEDKVEIDITGQWKGGVGPNLDWIDITLIDQKGVIIGNGSLKRYGYSAKTASVTGSRDDTEVSLTIEDEFWYFYYDGEVDGDKMTGAMRPRHKQWGGSDSESYTLNRK